MGIKQQKIGADTESTFQDYMREKGWWAHRFANNISGQPCDFVLVKNKRVIFADLKNVQDGELMNFNRLEENQKNAFKLLKILGNYNDMGWIIIFDNVYYFFTYDKYLKIMQLKRKSVYRNELILFEEYINENNN